MNWLTDSRITSVITSYSIHYTKLYELKLLWCTPDVCGVERNIDRQIAHDLYAALVCIGAQPRPLLIEQILYRLIEAYPVA